MGFVRYIRAVFWGSPSDLCPILQLTTVENDKHCLAALQTIGASRQALEVNRQTWEVQQTDLGAQQTDTEGQQTDPKASRQTSGAAKHLGRGGQVSR
jgi:hypothetical protein